MKHTVVLVQKGISAQSHHVSGKSGKQYGTATASPNDHGVAFKMSLEDYMANAHDIIGNSFAGQQWVPEFIPVASDDAKSLGKCSSPRCQLGEHGRPAEAEYIWDRSLFCHWHAPFNASPLFEGAPAISVAPAGKPEVEDVRPEMVERESGVGAHIVEQDEASPPEVLPPPAVGAEALPEERLFGGVEKPIPMPDLPKKAPVDAKTFEDPGAGPVPAPAPAAAPIPAPVQEKPVVHPKPAASIVEQMIDDKITTALSGVEKRLTDLITASKPPKTKMQGRRVPKELTEFQQLQKKATTLGINTFQKGKAQLEQEIDEKSNGRRTTPRDPVLET